MGELSRRQRIRLWFALYGGWKDGLVLAAASLAAGAMVLAILVPVGPDATEAGTIQDFGLLETDTGSRGRVVVRTDSGRTVNTHAPEDHRRRVGDRVELVHETMIWGKASHLRRTGCAARMRPS